MRAGTDPHEAKRPSLPVLHEIVALARRAPSMYNAQPWSWHAADGRLGLYADRTRTIPVADPEGRNLVIGCGAALHHGQVAAAALGWSTRVDQFPDRAQPDLLARVELSPATVSAQDTRLRNALMTRRTDRRRFGSWPVPPERLHHLTDTASGKGCLAVPVTDEGQRRRIERLVFTATTLAAQDARLVEEQQTWLDRGREDGVPLGSVPRLLPRQGSYRSRFGAGLLPQPDRELGDLDGTDGLVIMGGADTPSGWLSTGRGLSTLWLHAEAWGLSVVPLSQVVEVAETRSELAAEFPGGPWVPHLLLRLGWLSPARETLAASPRRPLADVLRS